MKRKILSITLAVALLLPIVLLTGCQQDKVLNIFTWADYFPRDVLDDFTKETGIQINFSTFEEPEDALVKLQAVNGGEYDIVLVSDYIIDIARREGLLQELDKAKIPNFKDILPEYQGYFYDPDDAYAVPYAAGTPLIVYDPSKVSFEIKGYGDLWNPELKDSVVVMDNYRMVIGMTLWSLGYSLNSTNENELAEAREKLFELKPNIRVLDYDRPQDRMISGETVAGFMFTPQVVEAVEGKPELEVVYPAEAMGFGIDACVVPVNAPNSDNAHTFLNFILGGEIAARCAEAEMYICCVGSAVPYLSGEFLSNKALYIPSEYFNKTEIMQDVGEITPVYEQIWTEYGNLKVD